MPGAGGSCLQWILHTCHSKVPFLQRIHETLPHGCEALVAVPLRDRSLHTSSESSAGRAVQRGKKGERNKHSRLPQERQQQE